MAFKKKNPLTCILEDGADYSSSDDNPDKKRKLGEPKLKTQEQIVRRREKNRILAKKTRQRKKFFFEVRLHF